MPITTFNLGKRILLLGAILAGLGMISSAAQARHQPYSHVYTTWYGGAPLTWGWWGPWSGPRYPSVPYGYSYWGYWNYQPYYASFGAISYSREADDFSFAWGQSTRWAAVNASQLQCGYDDCQNLIWVQGGCAAVASTPGGQNIGWAYHTSKSRANSYAIRGCRRSQGSLEGCEIRAWVCSY